MPSIGDLDINDLDVSTIKHVLFETLSQGTSREIGYRTLVGLAAVLSFAESMEMVTAGASNECRSIARQYRQRRPRSPALIPTYDDLRMMEASATGKWPVLIRTHALTGLRGSEGCRLTWDDVDFDGGFLRIEFLMHRFVDPVRIVPVPPMLLHMLADWKRDSAPNSANLVFPNHMGEMASPGSLLAGFIRIQKAAGIVIGHDGESKKGDAHRSHYPFFSLRRFCANWYFGEVGLDSHQTARLLGRSTGQLADDHVIMHSIEEWDLSRFATAERKVFPDDP
jgi:integrase